MTVVYARACKLAGQLLIDSPVEAAGAARTQQIQAGLKAREIGEETLIHYNHAARLPAGMDTDAGHNTLQRVPLKGIEEEENSNFRKNGNLGSIALEDGNGPAGAQFAGALAEEGRELNADHRSESGAVGGQQDAAQTAAHVHETAVATGGRNLRQYVAEKRIGGRGVFVSFGAQSQFLRSPIGIRAGSRAPITVTLAQGPSNSRW